MDIRKSSATTVVMEAMRLGVTSFDTAPTYKNEREVGAALSIGENDIRITIKIPKSATRPEQARKEVMQSLSLLQSSRADVILLHWPCDLIEEGTLESVWNELEDMKKENLCSVIGVCNFTVAALQKLLSCCTIKPALNQVERHPLLPQYDLLEYCDSQDVVIQAHTPLGHGLLLDNATMQQVAQESSMSSAQVLLLWNLQHNISVVTKFSSVNHGMEAVALMKEENTKLYLTPQQMKTIDDMSLASGPHRFVAPPFMIGKGPAYSWEANTKSS
jgi:diketogulonate reductase-like aldo/keto reductase